MSSKTTVILTIVGIVIFLGAAWTLGCGGPNEALLAQGRAEQACIDQAEAGIGRAAMRAAIDACRNGVKDGGAE